MQKNYSQIERYVRGIHRNIKGNLVAGAIIIFVMIIVHLVSGCEPVLPAEPENNKKTEILSHNQDSTNNQGGILPEPDISEWETDTTIYHTTTKPTK